MNLDQEAAVREAIRDLNLAKNGPMSHVNRNLDAAYTVLRTAFPELNDGDCGE